MKRIGFPKSARLLRTADYRRVYAEGKRRSLDSIVAFCHYAAGRDFSRVGFTLPKAFGPAVDRNRMKRRLREAVRRNRSELGPGWDIVLNPRRAALKMDFSSIEETLRKLFRSCSKALPHEAPEGPASRDKFSGGKHEDPGAQSAGNL